MLYFRWENLESVYEYKCVNVQMSEGLTAWKLELSSLVVRDSCMQEYLCLCFKAGLPYLAWCGG